MRVDWQELRDFLKPNRWKLMGILAPFFGNLFLASVLNVIAPLLAGKEGLGIFALNAVLSALSFILNVGLFVGAFGGLGGIVTTVLLSLIMDLVWWYLLSCTIVWTYTRFRRKKDNDESWVTLSRKFEAPRTE